MRRRLLHAQRNFACLAFAGLDSRRAPGRRRRRSRRGAGSARGSRRSPRAAWRRRSPSRGCGRSCGRSPHRDARLAPRPISDSSPVICSTITWSVRTRRMTIERGGAGLGRPPARSARAQPRRAAAPESWAASSGGLSGTRPCASHPARACRPGWGSGPGTRARSGYRARRTGRSGRARTAPAPRGAGWPARPSRPRDPPARGSTLAAPWSHPNQAPGPGSGDASVRASSHSTKQSNRSDFPPEARNRSRAALT